MSEKPAHQPQYEYCAGASVYPLCNYLISISDYTGYWWIWQIFWQRFYGAI
ncbi:hypothetical protein LC607_09180 [Nostoc sp. CHAB 5824]|nr:hypothetical protein [Nostoc sp. CHAB 5824]